MYEGATTKPSEQRGVGLEGCPARSGRVKTP